MSMEAWQFKIEAYYNYREEFIMVFEKVVKIIAEQLGVEDIASIKKETSLINDLEADSLDAVEIIMAIEDEFDVEIPDDEAEHFKNIGDIVTFVEKNL